MPVHRGGFKTLTRSAFLWIFWGKPLHILTNGSILEMKKCEKRIAHFLDTFSSINNIKNTGESCKDVDHVVM